MKKTWKPKTIEVWVKEPNKAGHRVRVANKLGDLQALVGGYLETIRIAADMTILVDEEGWLKSSPYNMTIEGVPLFGNIVLAGVRGADFTNCPEFDMETVIPGFMKEGKQA